MEVAVREMLTVCSVGEEPVSVPVFDNEPLVLPVCSPTDPPRRKADTAKWKQQHKEKASTLPLNLISATNQQKVRTG